MSQFLSVDGPAYKVCLVIYKLLVLNLLWFFFNIILFTIGASTTALFYATAKLIKDFDSASPAKDFWKSFKQNFRQATVIWLIMSLLVLIIYYNIVHIDMLGNWGSYLVIIYYVIIAELIITGIYIFPLLSRYHLKTFIAFKMAFYMSNRHFITTILCLMVLPFLYYLISWRWYFILFVMDIYAYWIYYLVNGKFLLYEAANSQENNN